MRSVCAEDEQRRVRRGGGVVCERRREHRRQCEDCVASGVDGDWSSVEDVDGYGADKYDVDYRRGRLRGDGEGNRGSSDVMAAATARSKARMMVTPTIKTSKAKKSTMESKKLLMLTR